MRTFTNRNKINGISFHHRTSQRGISTKSTLSQYFNLNDLMQQIKKESPSHLTVKEIQYFLCDQGRNEIHTHVSICAEIISKWTGIIKTMERCFPFRDFTMIKNTFHYNKNDSFECVLNELEVFLEAKKLLALWRHRLSIFEMIVEAQGSLRFLKINK